MTRQEAMESLRNAPTITVNGYWYVRIRPAVKNELLEMLEKQEPLTPCTEGSTIKWDGHLFCRDCGRSITTDTRFCSYCGRAIKWSTD